jgi:eukaryotic-like serine/threonine-protein kinase
MKTNRVDWNTVAELFHAAREIPSAARTEWLEGQTGGRGEVLEEVRSLLIAEETHRRLSLEAAHVPGPKEQCTFPSRQFGPYRTVRLLGQGGMGAVYLAHRTDGQFEQTVALKIMSAQLAGPEFLRKFETERQVLAWLSHPNITRLLDGGVTETGDPYLVMEFVDGQAIDCYSDERRLGVEERLKLFLEVCEAVDCAHRNLVLHRDLKPGNIFVDRSGVVKLLDFGTASLLSDDSGVTATHARMLTPRYSSPERLRENRSSISGDIFSLGVILYELLTGAWPFGNPGSIVSELQRVTGKSGPIRPANAITAEAAENRALSMKRLRRKVTGDLSAIVLKALAHDASRRYDSVRQMSEDIENFLNGKPVRARSQTATYQAGKFLARHWLSAGAVTLFLGFMTVVSFIALREADTTRKEKLKSEQVNQFLVNMLSSAGNLDFDPKTYTVIQMLDAAGRGLENGFSGDPLSEATLRLSLATSLNVMQQFDKASIHVDRAIRILQSLQDQETLAAAWRCKAQISTGRGLYAAAVSNLEDALALVQRLGEKAQPILVFRIKTDLAQLYGFFLSRELDRAGRLCREAVELAFRDRSIPRNELAGALTIWGSMLTNEAKDADAERILLQALETGRKEDPGGIWEFNPLYQLSVIYGRGKDYGRARAVTRQMVDICIHKLGPDHFSTAEATLTWARYAAETGDAKVAAEDVAHSIAILKRSFPSPNLNLWHGTRDASNILRLEGSYVEAEKYARESLAVAQAAGLSPSDPRTGNSWDEIALALAGQKKYTQAIPAFEQAVKVYELAGGRWFRSADTARRRIAEARQNAGRDSGP